MSRRPAARGYRAPLQLQQAALRVKTTGVPAERPVAGDHAVAGHDDRDRVVADRAGSGAVGLVVAGLVRHFRVGDQLAVRHACRNRKDLALERRQRRQVHGDVELAPLPTPVLIELARHRVHALRVGQDAGPVRPDDATKLERGWLRAVVDVQEPTWPDGDPERSERRVDDPVAHRLEPFAPCTSHQSFAGIRNDGTELTHRIASFTFFIASATRDLAASSLHSSACETSAYDSPCTLRSTNAAR